MMCDTCFGLGVRADPKVMDLIVTNLITGGAVSDEIDREYEAAGRTDRYWMVDTCPTCDGTGEI